MRNLRVVEAWGAGTEDLVGEYLAGLSGRSSATLDAYARILELAHAAVLADGTNRGPTKIAGATEDPRVTYERLAWAADWHVREETYRKAIAEVVNAHYRLPFSRHWGSGRTSPSDGQASSPAAPWTPSRSRTQSTAGTAESPSAPTSPTSTPRSTRRS